MATSNVSMENSGDRKLKYLGFVNVVAINAVVLVTNIYGYAKNNSGPLKSIVETVENAVSSVVNPVYDRVKGLPEDVLFFVDNKVDEATNKFGESGPALAKNVVQGVQTIVVKVSDVAKNFVEEARTSGPKAAISRASALSKDFAVSKLALAWYKIDHQPALHGFAVMALPTAAHWSEKYNNLVVSLTAKGYAVFGFVPLVPVEDLVKAYKQVESGVAKKGEPTSSSGSESD